MIRPTSMAKPRPWPLAWARAARIAVLAVAALLQAGAAAADAQDAGDEPAREAPSVTPAREAPSATRAREASAEGTAATPPPAPDRWCAPELDALPAEVCAYTPHKETSGPRTLVIFLHGVMQQGAGWQWAQQRAGVRIGARHGFSVLTPRGKPGIGPKGMESWWAWPTAHAAQQAHEDALIDQWMTARALLEKRSGKPFERVFVDFSVKICPVSPPRFNPFASPVLKRRRKARKMAGNSVEIPLYSRFWWRGEG